MGDLPEGGTGSKKHRSQGDEMAMSIDDGDGTRPEPRDPKLRREVSYLDLLRNKEADLSHDFLVALCSLHIRLLERLITLHPRFLLPRMVHRDTRIRVLSTGGP